MSQGLIQISNTGPLITITNYWATPYAEKGLVFCSVNADTIRVLLPPSRYGDLKDMRAAEWCTLSRGPWPEKNIAEAIEIVFWDGSYTPYCLLLAPDSFDLLPAAPEPGKQWKISVWVAFFSRPEQKHEAHPYKFMERVCYWQRVERIGLGCPATLEQP